MPVKTKRPRKPSTQKTPAVATEIVVLLDRSGSMATIQRDMEGGFNTFIAEQRKVTGRCGVTLVQFDSGGVETVYASKPLADVPNLTLVPRGNTPLLDALGATLGETKTRLPGQQRVMFLVITDGQENASREFKREQIKQLVEARTKDGWFFTFLGANVDAFAEAGSLGFSSSSTMDFAPNTKGIQHAYAAVACSATAYRGGAVGQSLSFSTDQRLNAAGDVQGLKDRLTKKRVTVKP